MTDLENYLLDTSCLLKLFIDEPGDATAIVRELLRPGRVLHVTAFALGEAATVLKRKLSEGEERKPGGISRDQYDSAFVDMISLLNERRLVVVDVPLGGMKVFEILDVARSGGVDFADSLHLEAMGTGQLGLFTVGQSAAVLVTCDGTLADLARQRGVRVWNPSDEAAPARP